MKYERIIAELLNKPWAILPEKLSVIRELLKLRSEGKTLTDQEIADRIGGENRSPSMYLAKIEGGRNGSAQKAVAVIPVHGVISHRMNLMSETSGGTSTELLTQQFRKAMADSSVASILFDIDSPGGSVEGIPELAAEIQAARRIKPIAAIANPMAASAAYWLASAAGQLAVIPSGQVGSIGVYTAHEDISKQLENDGIRVSVIKAGKYKMEANPFGPLSPEARDDIQKKVDKFYGMFVKGVAEGRGVSDTSVRGGFGEGRMVLAAQAKQENMVDLIATPSEVLRSLGISENASLRAEMIRPLPRLSTRELEVPSLVALDGSRHRSFGSVMRITPGVSGSNLKLGEHMKSTKEKIAELESRRSPVETRMKAIMESLETEGREMNENEENEYDGLTVELREIDRNLDRQNAFDQAVRRAMPVNREVIEEAGLRRQPAPAVARVESQLPKGTTMARMVIALVRAQGNKLQAAELAREHYKDTPEVGLILRAAAVAPLDTTTSGGAAQLIPAATQMQSEFLDLLRPATVIGRIPGLRRVPFNVAVPMQTGGGSYSWVGEGRPKPVTSAAFDRATLRWAKTAGIIVITDELARFSSPLAEGLIRNELVQGTARFLDQQFVDSSIVEVTNVSPASITNNISPKTKSGSTAEAFRFDINQLAAAFIANSQNPAAAVLLISATTAFALSQMVNALGQAEFPTINLTGGTFAGLPVIVSENIGDRLILLNASDILLADDGGVNIDMSTQASVEMQNPPTDDSPADDTVILKSLWQHNLIGLRVERYVTWKRARNSAVEWIDNVTYAPTEPGSPA